MELREDHLANIAINEKIWKLDAEKRTTEYGSKNDFFGYWRMDKIRFIESFDMAKFQTKCELQKLNASMST